MKLILLPLLAGLVSASPIFERAVGVPVCKAFTGTKADLTDPNQGGPVPFKVIPGSGTYDKCLKACFSPENAKCRTFRVRANANSGGACSLYDSDLSKRIQPNPGSTSTYYPLPGIVGWVPENVLTHYDVDFSKTKGSYEACRGFCLGKSDCLGFGYKEGGNCQLYNESLDGKVKAKDTSPYIQFPVDCARI